jgi:hypothetical protein
MLVFGCFPKFVDFGTALVNEGDIPPGDGGTPMRET